MPTTQFLRKRVHGVDDDVHALEQVVGHHRHHHVQLQLARLAAQHHGQVVAHHLEHGHVEHLGQHRVYLAGHNGGTGLHGGQANLVQARAGARGQQAEIVGNAGEVAAPACAARR
jgi:hypothetical protein